MEAGAAMSIMNEVCADSGIPKPFDMMMVFPFLSTYKYGNSGLGKATYDFIKNAASDETRYKGQAWRGAISGAASVAFPGSKQVYKGSQAFGRVTTKRNRLTFQKPKIKNFNKPMAAAFGAYPQYQREQDLKMEEKGKGILSKAKRETKRYVKKKLFK